MANDLLQMLMQRATTPVVPESATKPTVDALTEPKMDQSGAMAQLKGFGAGALEGARGLTSPLQLATMLPGIGSMGAGARVIGRIAPKVGRFSSLLAKPGKVIPARFARDLAGPMTEESISAAKAANTAQRAIEAERGISPRLLGRPDLVPTGGEDAFNAARSAGMAKPGNPVEGVYKRILERGGRDPEAGAIDPKLLLYGGAAGGAGLMAKKAYDTIVGMKGKAEEVNQAVNPFRRTEDILRQINEANNPGTK